MIDQHSLRILLADDDRALLHLMQKWLTTAGHTISLATDGCQAQQQVIEFQPQLLITDWEMPELDGPALCRWLRSQPVEDYIYTILLTSRSSSQDTIVGLEAGADDFLKKPIDGEELLARVRAAGRMVELQGRLKQLAKTDPLTNLLVRRAFVELTEREWTRATRHTLPISCVMIDVDFFKRINDTYGHGAGDQALRSVARILTENCRANDIVGRYGGEEFCVVLPETTSEYAVGWAERVRQAILSATGWVDGIDVQLSASFGVAQRAGDTQSLATLIDQADQALLVAKRSGRNRVVNHHAIVVRNPEAEFSGSITDLFRGRTAKDVMATIIGGLRSDEPIGQAIQHFIRSSFTSAPVVDLQGKLVGVLSERDVMSLTLLPNWKRIRIREVMRTNVVSYDQDTPLQVIYEFLCRVSMRGVIIVRDGRPVGMLSRSSLLRWFTNQAARETDPAESDRATHDIDTHTVLGTPPNTNAITLGPAAMSSRGAAIRLEPRSLPSHL